MVLLSTIVGGQRCVASQIACSNDLAFYLTVYYGVHCTGYSIGHRSFNLKVSNYGLALATVETTSAMQIELRLEALYSLFR